ncbi:hypothetical protein E2C01_006992 [Portunus trituberculatus]|uniref:Uncharacterized protein n=1 Tax=Portunus trituberculatus TaxID=210409 RepID=A0A5B7D3B2_PORTR|nr:hypothetical protein [Portunus trituberculatus]
MPPLTPTLHSSPPHYASPHPYTTHHHHTMLPLTYTTHNTQLLAIQSLARKHSPITHGKGFQRCALEGVHQPDDRAVRGSEDGLAVWTKLDARPVTFLLHGKLEGAEGPLVKRSFIPAAKMRPSGSNAATGRPPTCIIPWQLGDRRSHRRSDLSIEPEMKVSSMGLMLKVTTLKCDDKGVTTTNSLRFPGHRMARTTCPGGALPTHHFKPISFNLMKTSDAIKVNTGVYVCREGAMCMPGGSPLGVVSHASDSRGGEAESGRPPFTEDKETLASP